jgi:hypothetical protein
LTAPYSSVCFSAPESLLSRQNTAFTTSRLSPPRGIDHSNECIHLDGHCYRRSHTPFTKTPLPSHAQTYDYTPFDPPRTESGQILNQPIPPASVSSFPILDWGLSPSHLNPAPYSPGMTLFFSPHQAHSVPVSGSDAERLLPLLSNPHLAVLYGPGSSPSHPLSIGSASTSSIAPPFFLPSSVPQVHPHHSPLKGTGGISLTFPLQSDDAAQPEMLTTSPELQTHYQDLLGSLSSHFTSSCVESQIYGSTSSGMTASPSSFNGMKRRSRLA